MFQNSTLNILIVAFFFFLWLLALVEIAILRHQMNRLWYRVQNVELHVGLGPPEG